MAAYPEWWSAHHNSLHDWRGCNPLKYWGHHAIIFESKWLCLHMQSLMILHYDRASHLNWNPLKLTLNMSQHLQFSSSLQGDPFWNRRCQRHDVFFSTLYADDWESWLAFSWVKQNQYGLEYPAALQDYIDLSLFFFSLSSYNAMFYSNPIHAMACWVKVPQSSHYFTLNIALLGHYPDD